MHANLALISVPFDLDRHLQGAGLAPQALRAACLLERLAAQNLHVRRDITIADDLGAGSEQARVGCLQAAVASAVADALARGLLPVVLGGDCCNAIGVWSGIARVDPSPVGVAWFDAHGDWNTEQTTLSGYLGGMPYATICGYGNEELRRAAGITRPAPTARCALLGIRDLDAPEAALLATTDVQVVTAAQLHQGWRPAPGMLEAAESLYLHFDIDVLDPAHMPGVRFPVPGGLSISQAVSLARELLAGQRLAALTLASLDPGRDAGGRSVENVIRVICELLAST